MYEKKEILHVSLFGDEKNVEGILDVINLLKKRDGFFIDKYGYTGFQMMCANLTYLYRSNIYTDVKRKELKSIKRLLKKNKIKFEAKPIPLNYKRFKLKRFILSAYLRRWLKKIFTGKILKTLETIKNS